MVRLALAGGGMLLLPMPTWLTAVAGAEQEARMRRSNILVVYYSRTGTTAKLGDAMAQAVGGDVERLEDTVQRRGAMGFLRSMHDTLGRRTATLKPLTADPSAYDLVLVGTPDWGKSVSAPVRAFLTAYRGRFREVAFFLTDGQKDHAAIFREMTALAGRDPIACLGIPHDDVVNDRYGPRLAEFVRALDLQGPRRAPSAVPAPAVRP